MGQAKRKCRVARVIEAITTASELDLKGEAFARHMVRLVPDATREDVLAARDQLQAEHEEKMAAYKRESRMGEFGIRIMKLTGADKDDTILFGRAVRKAAAMGDE